MVADLKIYTKEYNDVWVVPVGAIGTNAEGESVIAVQEADGTFRDLVVTAGYSDGVRSEISGDGLNDGLTIRETYLSGFPGMGLPSGLPGGAAGFLTGSAGGN